MAPTVVLEYTKAKQMKRSSQVLSSKAKGKPPRSSRGYRSGSIPDCQRDSKKMVESEGSGSAIRANSSGNSGSPKRKKRIDVNVDRCNGFNVPPEVISLSKIAGCSKRKPPTARGRSEPEHIPMSPKKLPTKSVTTVGISTSSSIHGSEKIREQSIGPQLKGGLSGKSVPPNAVPVGDSYLAPMKQCEALLKKLMSHQFAWVFDHPVDAVKLNIPDYHTIIKHPMDLGTSGAYSSPWGFASDVRLTFKNAMTYNPPNDDVHNMAVALSKFFESRWKFIEKKLAAADAHIEKETQSNKSELSKKRKMPSPDYYSSVPERKKSKMMDVEKQCVNRCLKSLLADLSDHIINFLRWQSGNMDQSIEEIKSHIDSFCDDTLFKLRTLSDNYIKEGEVRRQVKTERVRDTGICTSCLHPCFLPHCSFTGNDLDDEDVDICDDDDAPIPSYPTLELEKDLEATTSDYSSSSCSSSDSGSSSGANHVLLFVPHSGLNGLYWCYWQHVGPLSGLTPSEMDVDSKPLSVDSDGCPESKHSSSERKVSPEKLYRAAWPRSCFTDKIVKARKSLDQVG
ncbi:hypothetical protein B296_00051188 [Ensete ventricosum]|uniref:Bromo domain-containing protein n=1 Tax=Ensete ventricosum TaxID=4639 RepID=A0A426X3V1_ENSVE|nr:hypothetical protein B296_00051188 [Ensete ventricosum]